jgi:transcriptional regulator with XRE-family HTH domain
MPARKPKARTPGEVFAGEVKRVRTVRGWSQQRLADEMARLGVPIDRSAIAKVERSARQVNLDEMVAFAIALGVSPLGLVVPHEAGAQVALTPKHTVPAAEAADWFRAVQLPPPLLPGDRGAPESLDAQREFHQLTPYGAEFSELTTQQRVDRAASAAAELIDYLEAIKEEARHGVNR